MKDIKSPTTFEEQLKIIKKRGCIIGDDTFAKEILKQINYYRMTAYFLPFKLDDGSYKDGTTFNNVYRNYEFDRKLRNLLFSIVEEIELMLRTQLSYYHAHHYGPLGYLNADCYNKKHDHDKFLSQLNEDIEHNKNKPAVKHHQENYDGQFPIWVVIELFTMGQLSFFYSDMHRCDRKEIAKNLFNTTDSNVISWLRCLTDLRNICAHYSRLYNYRMIAIPATPLSFPYTLKKHVFDYILVLKFLYFDPIKWRKSFLPQLEALISEYSTSIDMKLIGFPSDWLQILEMPNPKLQQSRQEHIR